MNIILRHFLHVPLDLDPFSVCGNTLQSEQHKDIQSPNHSQDMKGELKPAMPSLAKRLLGIRWGWHPIPLCGHLRKNIQHNTHTPSLLWFVCKDRVSSGLFSWYISCPVSAHGQCLNRQRKWAPPKITHVTLHKNNNKIPQVAPHERLCCNSSYPIISDSLLNYKAHNSWSNFTQHIHTD